MADKLRSQIAIAIISGLVVPAIIGVGAFIWQSLSEGALVRILGGIPRSEFVPVPDDAVIIVDSPNGCSDKNGWVELSIMDGRTVLGASSDVNSVFYYRRRDGEEKITLTKSHLPDHSHVFHDVYYAESDEWRPRAETIRVEIPETIGVRSEKDTGNVGWAFQRETGSVKDQSNGVDEYTNLPPYVALYFCKRKTGG